jgi:tetratricopeptide (TPR) repeat protein
MDKAINKQLEKAETNPLISLKHLLGIIIAAFAFILYAQSISFDYTLDDVTVTKENKVVKKGFSGISEILTKDYWYGYNNDLRVPEYRPTSLLILAAEWQFFPENPHISHFINVFIYALTCWLLFLLLCKLFEKQHLIIPFVCTLLYVAHPIHTEVVNNIKSLDDILCFLFFVISALFIVKYTSNKSIGKLIFGAVFYFLSLLSKETGITFLVGIPLLLFCFNKGSIKKILSITLVLLGVSGLYFIIRYFVLKDIPHSHLESWLNNSLYSTNDFMIQRATAFGVLVRYIILLIFPHPLSYDYSFNQIKMIAFSDPLAIAGVVIYIALIILGIILLRKKSFLAAGILFYLVTLSPVSNLFLLINSTMAERFMYIPSLGFCLVITFILIKITRTKTIKLKTQSITEFAKGNIILLSILFVITALYSFKTITRSQDWKDDPTLFEHDVKIVDNSGRAHYNYANTLLISVYPHEINPAKKDILIREIINEFNKALDIYPNFPNAYNYLSTAYIYKRDYKDALICLEKYNSIRTVADPLIHINLSFLYSKTKQYDKEIAEIDSLIKDAPQDPMNHLNKGIALGNKGDDSLAMKEFNTTLEMNPKSAPALKNLGVAYAKKNQYKTALEYFNKCNTIDSTDVENINFMGMVYQSIGDTSNARKNYDKVTRLRKGAQQ